MSQTSIANMAFVVLTVGVVVVKGFVAFDALLKIVAVVLLFDPEVEAEVGMTAAVFEITVTEMEDVVGHQ